MSLGCTAFVTIVMPIRHVTVERELGLVEDGSTARDTCESGQSIDSNPIYWELVLRLIISQDLLVQDIRTQD